MCVSRVSAAFSSSVQVSDDGVDFGDVVGRTRDQQENKGLSEKSEMWRGRSVRRSLDQ